MTKEAYDRAKLLFVRIDAYTSKLTDIAISGAQTIVPAERSET